ncbi:ABC transporter permease [Paenibacillus elgii]|uniref:ABC transporter permease n=1 Tax=Paenibacillus elgii TaxID=189691 RepID=UPI000248E03C|nr:ABC transporter permease [Paenibacillus elgii]
MKSLFAAEWLKLKHSRILWIVILMPILLTAQGVGNFTRYSDIWTRDDWTVIIEQCLIFYPPMLLPFFIAIVIALMIRIEHSHNGWKHLLALPVRRGHIYAAKFGLALLLVVLNIAVFGASIVAAGLVAGANGPIPLDRIALPLLRLIPAVLPIMAIQFWLSLRYRHIGIPLGIGIGLAVPSLLVANSKYWIVYPWTYPTMAALASQSSTFSKGPLLYGAIALVFLLVTVIGFTEFRRRDIL